MLLRSTRFPLTVSIGLRRSVTVTNGFGDEVRDYGDPETVKVFAYYITGGSETGIDGHTQQVEHDAVVFAPTELGITAEDRIDIPDGTFDVSQPPGNWDNNPWWSPGLVQVKLKRVSRED